ncbi:MULTISPECIES: TetR/AcrR family transcriptional regulator [Pseudonocardia]|uniref:FadR n=2 Tax=Pseudonocardia TaxID=1847 RepID=Q5ENI0_PSEAH|nr:MULTISPECIES: TetR/AcrR family transcriptional regulator [Pseudonocardia]AAW81702.1 FadR [Pseudonocardia autotrophica]OSY36984.1 HTH-type transcriptional regulator SrpR [Pseudonocardia autotrophica]
MRADARRNREQLVTAARQVFLEQGVDAPLDEIARRAGVGIATLYRRFPDRQALIQQVMQDNLERSRAALERAAEEHSDAWSALVAYLHDVVDEQITLLVPVLAPNIHEELRRRGDVWSRREEVIGRFEQLVQAAKREGRLRGDVGAGDLEVWMVKVCRPIPVLTTEQNELATHRQLRVLIDGLLADTAGGPLPGTPQDGRVQLVLTGLDTHSADAR